MQEFLRRLVQERIGASEKPRFQQEHELLDLILDAGGDAATTVRTLLYALAPQARAGSRKQTKAG